MSRNQSKPIDFADLRLEIRPALKPYLQAAVAEFEEQHDHIEVTPRWRKEVLLINSTDLIAALGYFNGTELSELELRGLRKQISEQLDQALLRSTNLDAQAHYKWCMAALKSLEWGRYL